MMLARTLWRNPDQDSSDVPRSASEENAQSFGVIMYLLFFMLSIGVLTPNGLTEIISILSLFSIDKVLL